MKPHADHDEASDASAGPDSIELYLLRHAHAGDPLAWRGPDERRPLSQRGRKQADRLARFLADSGFRPDAIITSPMVRAAETAERLGERLKLEVIVDHRLAQGPDLGDLDGILTTAGDPARPVLVGHDPSFSAIAADLASCPDLAFAKGTLVRIDCLRPLVLGSGVLRWVIPPDALKAERPDG
jgi:phosphohistidine phosphatase